MNVRDKFTYREVEISFRKFNDLANDLFSSKHQVWGDCFNRLLSHCENDPVMQVVTGPLKSNPRVDANKWWADAIASVQGMSGTAKYCLPSDDDERTALLYQVFLKVLQENISISRFCNYVYGSRYAQDMTNAFNGQLVKQFTREVSYRLDAILQDS